MSLTYFQFHRVLDAAFIELFYKKLEKMLQNALLQKLKCTFESCDFECITVNRLHFNGSDIVHPLKPKTNLGGMENVATSMNFMRIVHPLIKGKYERQMASSTTTKRRENMVKLFEIHHFHVVLVAWNCHCRC